jgi:hypothetical protein
MTDEEYEALINKMEEYAGCKTCESYNNVRCAACVWADAMDCVNDFYRSDYD